MKVSIIIANDLVQILLKTIEADKIIKVRK